MINKNKVDALQRELSDLFASLSALQDNIRQRLIKFADGKTLKGNELVGWLGEIYGKILFDGRLVGDSEEHDIQTSDGRRISVKTRKGWKSGWKQTSAIPKIEGSDCPTHLLFVHLNDDYSIDRMWLYEWGYLRQVGRFKSHLVRGNHRSFIFNLDEGKDEPFVIFQADFSELRNNNSISAPVPPAVEANPQNARGNQMTTKERARVWLRSNHPQKMQNMLRVSKFFPEKEIWFFTFPGTYFESNKIGCVNILCESESNINDFRFLEVPYAFFRENQGKFNTRSNGSKFDLHISAKGKNWMIDERSENVSFRQFEVA